MQPKFTLKHLGYFGSKILAVSLVFVLLTQFSFAQQKGNSQANNNASNDAGILVEKIRPTLDRGNPQPEVVCATFNGSLDTGDPTMGFRPFRDGIASTCGPIKPCTAGLTAANTYYDVLTWVNPLTTSQCITISFTNGATGFNNFVAVYQTPFVPVTSAAGFCTGNTFLGDIGSSTGAGATESFSITVAGLQSIDVLISAVGGLTTPAYTLVIDAPVCTTTPCSGTPNPGNTITSGPNPICPGINFTLSAQNPTPGLGVTYQWYSAPAVTGPWTIISGATSANYTTSLSTTPMAYQVEVTCSGNPPATSNPLFVDMNPPSSCYCIPPGTNCTDNDVITRVLISTLDNSSTCGTGPPAGYTNYIGTVAAPDVFAGAGNQMTVEAPPNWPESIAAWIDYDKNGQFEVSEFTLIGNKPAGGTSVTNVINIPANAQLGLTRMRVRISFATTFNGSQACIGYTFGETEDYEVNIVPCVPISITGHPANVSTQCSGNASFTVTTTGSLPQYAWEYRVNSSSAWQNVTATAPHSGVTGLTSATLTFSNVPNTLNGYQFRALVSGGCSALDFSNPATLTVTPLIATVNPASATICTGSVQALNLTNATSPTTVSFTNTTPLAIPDATPAGVFSTIPVAGIPAGAIITNITVTLNITHTWVGDLEINLIAPNGSNMNLIGELDNGTGSNSTDDFVDTRISSTSNTPLSGAPAPRTGTFAADRLQGYGPSGAFQTQPNGMPWSLMTSIANGNWQLGLSDWFAFDIGTLQNWTINITYGAPAAGVWSVAPSSPNPSPNTMFTDPAATVPYTGTLESTIYVNPTANTIYQVVFSTSTPCTSPPTNIPVNVVNPVSAVVDPTNQSVCVGGDVSFTVSAAGGPISYQWQVSTNGGASYSNITGATSATLNLTGVTQSMHNNLYRVQLSAPPCAGTTTSAAATLTVNPLPTVLLSASPTAVKPGVTTTITVSSTPAGATYSWTFNGNPLEVNGVPVTGSSYVANVDGIGTYTVTVTDVNGCTSTSSPFAITGQQDDRLFIYPNPAPDGQFQVRLFSGINFDYRKVNIYNSSGHRIVSREFPTSGPWQKMEFNLGNAASGVYIVEVLDRYDTKLATGKVVIQR